MNIKLSFITIAFGLIVSHSTYLLAGDVVPAQFHPKFVNPLPKLTRIDGTKGGNLVIQMRQSQQWLGLVDGAGNKINTPVWGYSQAGYPAQHLGPTIIAKENVPLNIEWQNLLTGSHLFPTGSHNHVLHTTNGAIPSVVHLHGGHTEMASDGDPMAWYTSNYQQTGPAFAKRVYHYDNTQNASTLWYHDHTMGITRLNLNAGLAGMYLVRDNNELNLALPKGDYEKELVIQDLQINNDGTLARKLEFPAYFGLYVTVNGMTWPYLNVEPRKYRFRLVNASDSRYYDLQLSNFKKITEIGTEGGLLEKPTQLDKLLIAPGERYDLVIDFSSMAGQTVTLNNLTGILPGIPNVVPSTSSVMQFRVGSSVTTADTPLPTQLRTPLADLGEAVTTRRVMLSQSLDVSPTATVDAPIIDLLGTLSNSVRSFMDDVTETPKIGDVEIWEIYNTSLVTHAIHLHQVEFSILDRQPILSYDAPVSYFANAQDNRSVHPIKYGAISPPNANEMGQKDIVIVQPSTVARIKVKFDLLGDYVWHCHMLTHEDHDMMRPLKVVN